MPFEFPMRGEHHVLTPAIRAALPGDFISLPDGVTHFNCDGPEDGPLVVLVHGFSVPYFIWDPTFEALKTSGFRVLRYDLFGRGTSDRPFIKNDLELFTRQLADLMDVLGYKQAHSILGLSMGGLIAANFCVRYPERVGRLGLFDPAGFPIKFPLAFQILLAPLLGELFIGLAGNNLFRRLAVSAFYDPEHIDQFEGEFVKQMPYKGFRRSLLSTVRSGMLEAGPEVYSRLGAMEMPVLLVWGEDDHTAPFSNSEKLIELVPQAEFYPIPGSGHIPHYEHAEQVNPIIKRFLNE